MSLARDDGDSKELAQETGWTPIDDDKRSRFIGRCVVLLGEITKARTVEELVHYGNELQSAGLVLRGELSLEEFLN